MLRDCPERPGVVVLPSRVTEIMSASCPAVNISNRATTMRMIRDDDADGEADVLTFAQSFRDSSRGK